MTYITCDHPLEKTIVRAERIATTDLLRTYTKPKAYCNNCDSYISELETPGRQIINFWFIRQDGKVRAAVLA